MSAIVLHQQDDAENAELLVKVEALETILRNSEDNYLGHRSF